MTIAAGFCCHDGVVLCADSQETISDYLKVTVPKLVVKPRVSSGLENCMMVFAGAGHGPFIDKLVYEMWKAASKAGPSFDEIADAAEDANLETYRKIWGVHPAPPSPTADMRPMADLLYAITTEDRVRLFRSPGPGATPVDDHACVGAGDILAEYIASKMNDRPHGLPSFLTAREGSLVALYLLQQTKQHAPGCGGNSDIVVIKAGKTIEWMTSVDVAAMSDTLSKLEDVCNKLRLATPDLQISDEGFEQILTECTALARLSRKQQHEFMKQIERVQKGTGRKKRPGSSK